MRILTEASGSLVAAYLIRAVQEAGHVAVASDIDPRCAGRYLADDYINMPASDDPALWAKVETLLRKHRIDVVIPSLDEMLLGWAERRDHFRALGMHVVVSDADTVRTFRDKWLTYQFFMQNGIPTPTTSLEQQYPLVKPRYGRGSQAVRVNGERVSMVDMVSQEIVWGDEFTVDVLCDRLSRPVYVVPRKRQQVREGKSCAGVVVMQEAVVAWVERICGLTCFMGPVNMQCFVQRGGEVKFIEVNPRVAGGMALGFAATENWITPIINGLVRGEPICAKAVQFGMEMRRYYAEVFVPPS